MTKLTFLAALAAVANAAAWTAAPTECAKIVEGLNKAENKCDFYTCVGGTVDDANDATKV